MLMETPFDRNPTGSREVTGVITVVPLDSTPALGGFFNITFRINLVTGTELLES